VPVLALDAARAEPWDVAVSTSWPTTSVLFELPARRHAALVAGLEDSAYEPEAPEQLAAAMVTSLPVRFITGARWLAELLEDLQPGNRVLYVRDGIAKDVFRAPAALAPAADGAPLRVVLFGDRDDRRSGVEGAVAAVAAMAEPVHVTWIAPRAVAAPPGVDRVLGGLSASELADVLGRSDVVLDLPRAKGMSRPPLEAFHRGATVVTTPVTGHEEYVRHGANGLVVGWDDPRGTARTLDLLARDRRLLHELRTGALQTAATWPDWRQASGVMALALRRVAAEPGPPVAPAGRRLASDFASATADAELARRRLDQALEAYAQLAQERTLGNLAKARGRAELGKVRGRLGPVKRRLLGAPKRLLKP
jgi:glycosyltransferase involved in cell wall biosynthesis